MLESCGGLDNSHCLSDPAYLAWILVHHFIPQCEYSAPKYGLEPNWLSTMLDCLSKAAIYKSNISTSQPMDHKSHCDVLNVLCLHSLMSHPH
jgi:hypothetical protein